MGDLGARYMVTSVPTLLTFMRGEARLENRMRDGREMVQEEKVREWIEAEARIRDTGKSLFGGLFRGNGG